MMPPFDTALLKTAAKNPADKVYTYRFQNVPTETVRRFSMHRLGSLWNRVFKTNAVEAPAK